MNLAEVLVALSQVNKLDNYTVHNSLRRFIRGRTTTKTFLVCRLIHKLARAYDFTRTDSSIEPSK